MHLVSWDILIRPTSEGGLQIRDLGLANLALGGKLMWHIYVNKNHPVSKIFKMKYLKGGSLRNLSISTTQTGTTIWTSFRRGIDQFNQHL